MTAANYHCGLNVPHSLSFFSHPPLHSFEAKCTSKQRSVVPRVQSSSSLSPNDVPSIIRRCGFQHAHFHFSYAFFTLCPNFLLQGSEETSIYMFINISRIDIQGQNYTGASSVHKGPWEFSFTDSYPLHTIFKLRVIFSRLLRNVRMENLPLRVKHFARKNSIQIALFRVRTFARNIHKNQAIEKRFSSFSKVFFYFFKVGKYFPKVFYFYFLKRRKNETLVRMAYGYELAPECAT